MLLTVIAILPSVFDAVSTKYERTKLKSRVVEKTFARYFNYQMANIYVTVLVGSIFEDLKQCIDNPGTIMSTIAASIPKVAGYFTCLVIIKATCGLALDMMLIGAVLKRAACRLGGCVVDVAASLRFTSREEEEEEEEEATDHDDEEENDRFRDCVPVLSQMYGDKLLVLIVCLTYCVLFPPLQPFGMLYFALSWFVRRYKALTFHVPAFESGGQLFFSVFTRVMVGLYFSVAVSITYLLTKSPAMSPFVVPIFFVIWLFQRHCERVYVGPSRYLSRLLAVKQQRLSGASSPPPPPSLPEKEQPLLSATVSNQSRYCDGESVKGTVSQFSGTLYRQRHLFEKPVRIVKSAATAHRDDDKEEDRARASGGYSAKDAS